MEVETFLWDNKMLDLDIQNKHFKIWRSRLELQLMLSVQDMTITGYQREIKLIRRSKEDNLEI